MRGSASTPRSARATPAATALAPELFDVDDYGQSSVTSDAVPAELEDKARLAIANCPEYAIEIVSE